VLNVIDFLERMGQDADLKHASAEMLEEALRDSGIEPALRAALLGKDRRALEGLLGTESTVCCIIFKDDEEEEEKPTPQEEDEEEQEDDSNGKT
jgi:hypothetical protein